MFLSGLVLSNDQRKSQDLYFLFSWEKKPLVLMEQRVCQGGHRKLNRPPSSRWFLQSVYVPDMVNIVPGRPTCGFQITANRMSWKPYSYTLYCRILFHTLQRELGNVLCIWGSCDFSRNDQVVLSFKIIGLTKCAFSAIGFLKRYDL